MQYLFRRLILMPSSDRNISRPSGAVQYNFWRSGLVLSNDRNISRSSSAASLWTFSRYYIIGTYQTCR